MDDNFDCGIDSDDMFSDDSICSTEEGGAGFYLNSTDAACNGALFQVGDDDDGPGFYI